MRMLLFAAAVLAAAVSSGCGDVSRGRIHGKVTWNGKPLTGATVIFIAKDNKTHPVKLKTDGSYEVNGVAYGPIKVSIQQDLPSVASKSEPRASSQAKGVADEKAGKAPPSSPIAEKSDYGPRLAASYTDAEKSGLTFEMKEPDQEWSVDLK
jgi:hypothetical protein